MKTKTNTRREQLRRIERARKLLVGTPYELELQGAERRLNCERLQILFPESNVSTHYSGGFSAWYNTMSMREISEELARLESRGFDIGDKTIESGLIRIQARYFGLRFFLQFPLTCKLVKRVRKTTVFEPSKSCMSKAQALVGEI